MDEAGSEPDPRRRADAIWRPHYQQLAPGPGSRRAVVASHQRARIHGAMIELVAEHGYVGVTVLALVRRARVSSRTFYEHFDDKDECFLATYDLIVRRSARRVIDAQAGVCDWQKRLVLAFKAWTDGIARQPKMARLALIEAFAGGPAALERMRRAREIFEAMIAHSFARAPDAVAVPPLILRGIVTGLHRVARTRLLGGRAEELPGLAEEILEWTLCFRCEGATAVARMCDSSAAARVRPQQARAGGTVAARTDVRARILDAVVELTGRDGYWRLTVPLIRTAAGVSRKSFDEHFGGVEDCFIATLEDQTERTFARVAPAALAGESWGGGLHRMMHALCEDVAANPGFARLAFVEALSPGPNAVRCIERLIARASELYRASAPPGRRPSELVAEASLGAVCGAMHHYVVGGQATRLPEIAPALSFLVLAPAVGADSACAAIVAECERRAVS